MAKKSNNKTLMVIGALGIGYLFYNRSKAAANTTSENPNEAIEKKLLGWVKYITDAKWNTSNVYASALFELGKELTLTQDQLNYLRSKFNIPVATYSGNNTSTGTNTGNTAPGGSVTGFWDLFRLEKKHRVRFNPVLN